MTHRVMVGQGSKASSLAAIALKNRLYVSGWDLSGKLQEIKKGYENGVVAMVFLKCGTPVAVSIVIDYWTDHEGKCKQIQCFTRKALRGKGLGSLALRSAIEFHGGEVVASLWGISSSHSFFTKHKIQMID